MYERAAACSTLSCDRTIWKSSQIQQRFGKACGKDAPCLKRKTADYIQCTFCKKDAACDALKKGDAAATTKKKSGY